MQTQREGEGQSYFYVLWPEDRVTALGSSRSQGIMPQISQCTDSMASDSPGNPSQQVVLTADDSSEQGSGGSSASSLEPGGTGRARDVDSARAANEHALSCTHPLLESSVTISNKDIPNSIAQPATADLNIRCLQTYGAHHNPPQNFFSPSPLSSSESSPDQDNCSPPPPKKYCSTSRVSVTRGHDRSQKPPTKRLSVPEMTGSSILPSLGQCLECEVKDAEILALRKRIQVMQDHLGMLLNRGSLKNGQVHPESDSLSSSPDAIIPVASGSTNRATVPAEGEELTGKDKQARGFQSNSHASHTTNKEQQFETGDTLELVHGSGVYIAAQKLDEALRDAKNGTQLARKLMDAFWDKTTLARSSVSPRSKYQYQQLDPKVTAAIETYCLAYDKNTHPKDLHATMTDKCCQCRRGVGRM